MRKDVKEVIRKVLSKATDVLHFFDWSGSERLNWCIAKGYQLGKARCRKFRLRLRGDSGIPPE